MNAKDMLYASNQILFDASINPFVEVLELDGLEIPYIMDTKRTSSNMQRYGGRGRSYSETKIWIRSSDIQGKELTNRHEFRMRDRVYYLGSAGVDKDDGFTIRINLTLDPTEGEDNVFEEPRSGGW